MSFLAITLLGVTVSGMLLLVVGIVVLLGIGVAMYFMAKRR